MSRLVRVAFPAWLTMALFCSTVEVQPPVKVVPDDGDSARSIGILEVLDPRLEKLVARDVRMEILRDGLDWSEGPVWIKDKDGGYLLFSDVPQNKVFGWSLQKGDWTHLSPSGYTSGPDRGDETGSNGLTLDPEGRLVLMQHGDRRVSRLGKDGQFVTMADRFEGKRLNSPNDGVFKSNGDFYFTDPPYGLVKKNADPAKELAHNGVYRVAKDGTLTLLTKEMTYPNGIAFSPDEKTLYVANSDPNRAVWMAFPVKADGMLGEGTVFYDATPLVGKKLGLPDGMKVDRAGNLFASGPGGILIFHPDGTLLGTFVTGERTANCAWGDNGSTLYITADMYLGRIKTKTKGNGF